MGVTPTRSGSTREGPRQIREPPQKPGQGADPRALRAPELTAHLRRKLVAACYSAQRRGREAKEGHVQA